jgi:probable HAF family extracellular repeat protein
MGKASWGVVLLSVSFAAGAAELYNTTRYGDGRVWGADDLNDNDEVVGAFDNAYYAKGPEVVEVIAALEGETGLAYSSLHGINNRGVMVGESTTGTNNSGPHRAFIFDRAVGVARDLGSLRGINGASAAWAINESNAIVGESETTNGTHAALFDLDGSITDLGTFGGTWSIACDINENGEIVGQSKDAQDNWRAFVIPSRNIMVDLGTLGGKEAYARRINNKGQIVGASQTTNGEWHACLWSPAGTMTDLGTLDGGTFSEAFGINDSGVVVGTFKDKSGSSKAFVWYPGGPMRNLGTIVKLPEGDFAWKAEDINNNGVIVAAIFHPVYRTGIEYPAVFRPGAVSAEATAGQWKTTMRAPPGYEVQLDSTRDFKTWTIGLATSAQDETIIHTEPLGSGSQFFRVSLKPLAIQ